MSSDALLDCVATTDGQGGQAEPDIPQTGSATGYGFDELPSCTRSERSSRPSSPHISSWRNSRSWDCCDSGPDYALESPSERDPHFTLAGDSESSNAQPTQKHLLKRLKQGLVQVAPPAALACRNSASASTHTSEDGPDCAIEDDPKSFNALHPTNSIPESSMPVSRILLIGQPRTAALRTPEWHSPGPSLFCHGTANWLGAAVAEHSDTVTKRFCGKRGAPPTSAPRRSTTTTTAKGTPSACERLAGDSQGDAMSTALALWNSHRARDPQAVPRRFRGSPSAART